MHTLRDYGVPFLLAIFVHAAAVVALMRGWTPDEVDPRVIKPRIVNATLIVLDPPKVKSRPPAQPQRIPERPQETPPPPEPKIAETPPEPKVDPEEVRKRREEEERQKRLRDLAERAFEQALEQEAIDLVESAKEAEALAYVDGIYQAIVANWSRPPSARNDMQAKLLVELIPTGEVVSVTLVASSGNTAFDRSSEAAVRKARRFDVPDDLSLFEEHFRKFTLLFKPEDLLR